MSLDGAPAATGGRSREDPLSDGIGSLLAQLYPGRAEAVTPRMLALVAGARTSMDALAASAAEPHLDASRRRPSHATACLITYGDAVRRDGEAPLRTLHSLLQDRVGPVTASSCSTRASS